MFHPGKFRGLNVLKRRLVADDLELLRGITDTADRFTSVGRNVRFSEWLGEFSRSLTAELDYVAEAENLDRFRLHLAPFRKLWVPAPVWDYTGKRVLTMELAGGRRVDEISGLRRTEQGMTPLAEDLLRGYLDQIFVHGEIHADPHPGNLRVTEDGRLAIFDLGMVANLPPRQRDRLLKLLFAAVDGRGDQVAEECIALGIRLEDYDEPRFLREVGQLIARYGAHQASMSARRRSNACCPAPSIRKPWRSSAPPTRPRSGRGRSRAGGRRRRGCCPRARPETAAARSTAESSSRRGRAR